LLAKPTQLNINLSSDRFAMFNKERDISHVALARDCGVTTQQMNELASWPGSTAFAPEQKAALSFAEKAAQHLPIDESAATELRRHFSAREIVELAMVVGFYVSTAIFIKALAVPAEKA